MNCKNTFFRLLRALCLLLFFMRSMLQNVFSGSVISRHVQFCGQRNWLCKLLPDSKCTHVSKTDKKEKETHYRLPFSVCLCLADRSPGRVPQEVIRAASECSASDQSSSGWVSDQHAAVLFCYSFSLTAYICLCCSPYYSDNG